MTIIETLQQLSHGSAKIIYFSRYRADQVDNGGARRVAQMLQLLHGYDLEFVTSMTRPSAGNATSSGAGSLLDMAVKAVVRGRYRQYTEEFATWIFFSRRLAKRWARSLAKRENLRLVIVDDPIFFAPLVQVLHARAIPVIAHCHNIETLSRAQVQSNYQKQVLVEELALLSLCRAAITISHEETFLLKNIGLQAFYLPYYPPQAIERRLLEVRQLRTRSSKRNFLLLGSAGNAPTRIGMQQLITMWGKVSPQLAGECLVVAGYGTEQLQVETRCASLEFAGAVSDDKLDALLATVRAAVVFQEDGAGALTRIAEFLLAGIPVVANSHAARSYHHLPGIFEFYELAELPEMLEKVRTYSGETGPPLSPDGTALLHEIDSLPG